MKSLKEIYLLIDENINLFYNYLGLYISKYKYVFDIDDIFILERIISFVKTTDRKKLYDKLIELYDYSILNEVTYKYADKIIKSRNFDDIKRIVNIYKTDSYRLNQFRNWIVNHKQSLPEDIFEYLISLLNYDNNNDIVNEIINELNGNNINLVRIMALVLSLNSNEICNDNIVNNVFNSLFNCFKNEKNKERIGLYDSIRRNLCIKLNIDFETINGKYDWSLGEDDSKKLKYSNIIYLNDYEFENDKIIAIDDYSSLDLDGAFSIFRDSDVFHLTVYITDVVNFLHKNRDVAKYALYRAFSIYNRDNTKYMLPYFLATDKLSLRGNKSKNVIAFRFLIDKIGNIKVESVDYKNILVDYYLDQYAVNSIINNRNNNPDIFMDLCNLVKVCKIVASTSSERYLSRLNYNNVGDLVGLQSILINYYIANNADIAIYRNGGEYTKVKGDYTHSSTPLRRIVSDINLGLYLNQIGLLEASDKEYYEIIDNMDTIINYVNAKEKKYYKSIGS